MANFSGLKNFFSRILNRLPGKFWGKNKFLFLSLFLVVVAIGVFGVFRLAHAETAEAGLIARFLAWILSIFISLFAELLMFLVKMLIKIATYNSFVVSTAVINGWVIVRDLCNMFFIVILLAIAIATILKVEAYHYKKLLGRLILMAILINFSKTIAGIIIDLAQVLTLTFVNGFKAAAGGNFVTALGLDSIMKIKPGGEPKTAEIAGAYALGLIMVIVSCVVVGVMMVIFLIRIVMLWILIVLSPLAFLLMTFPQGQKYASQWWSQFGNYVIVGPVMAFFLWLSLTSVATLSQADKPLPLEGEKASEMQQIGVSEIGGEEKMQSFIIAIGMLIGGLMITQQLGIMGSSMAGAVVSGMKRAGMAPVKWAGKKAKGAATRASEAAYAATGIALPFSKVRAEQKEARAKSMREQRMAKGEMRASQLASQGGFARAALAMAASPRTRRDLTFSQTAGAIVGRKASREKFREGAKGMGKSARHNLAAKDPLKAWTMDQTYEARNAGREAKVEEKKAKKYNKEKEKLQKRQSSLTSQIGQKNNRRARIEMELGEVRAEQKLPDEELAGRIPDLDEQVKKRVEDIDGQRAGEGKPPMTDRVKEVLGRGQRESIIKERRDGLAAREKKLVKEDGKLDGSVKVDTGKLESVVNELKATTGVEGEHQRLSKTVSDVGGEKNRLEARKGEIESALAEFAKKDELKIPLTSEEQAERGGLAEEYVTISGNIKVQADALEKANKDLTSLLEQHKDLQEHLAATAKAQNARQKEGEARSNLRLSFNERWKLAKELAKKAKELLKEDTLLQGMKKMLEGKGKEEVAAVKEAVKSASES